MSMAFVRFGWALLVTTEFAALVANGEASQRKKSYSIGNPQQKFNNDVQRSAEATLAAAHATKDELCKALDVLSLLRALPQPQLRLMGVCVCVCVCLVNNIIHICA